jgi:GT2 family glycosyltransferase
MISIVVALYNRLDRTQPFLASLERHAPPEPWEIVWVDDGSTDGTREWLRTLPAPRHRVLLNERNLGFAASNNRGAKAAAGTVLALLNNDLVLTLGWFAPLAERLVATPRIGVVGNVHLQPATGRIDHAGIVFDLAGLPDHFAKNRPPRLSGDGRFVRAVSAACWLVRRETFLDHGGFDEAYRNGGEDVDFCLALGRRGLRHWVDHRSRVWHHVSSSPGRKDRDRENLRLFLTRWGSDTAAWGREDWPRNYLRRHLHQPWRFNGAKLADALLRLARLRHGDSAWAAARRAAIFSEAR